MRIRDKRGIKTRLSDEREREVLLVARRMRAFTLRQSWRLSTILKRVSENVGELW